MEEISLVETRSTAALVLASTPPVAGAAGGAGIWEALEDLDAQELRLYALGWGDHLPIELLERIDALRRHKLALQVELERDVDRGG